MSNESSNLLRECSSEIMDVWEKRALEEIKAAHFQHTLALRNSLPIYLTQLVDALSTTIDRTSARKRFDKDASTRIGQKHGRERAGSTHYTMDQMILEYHILRQVICDVLERDSKLSDIDLEVITCSVEQAVNDAATQFSETLRYIQEQLTRTLAHDLRTPLTSAKLNAQLIIKKENQDPFFSQKARSITNHLDRLDSMICDLLDVSRLRAGQNIPLDFESFDLTVLLNKIVEAVNLDNASTAIFKFEGKCIVNWNQNGIRRLFENLVSNGFKYGKENTPVELTLTQSENFIKVAVHNEGKVIPEQDREALFNPYTRAKSAEDQIGWGLGLTVVKGMVDGHKGAVKIESEKESGTSFIVELPRDPNLNEEKITSSRESSEDQRLESLK